MTEATEVFAGDGKPTWDVGCVFFGLVGLPKKRVCFLNKVGILFFLFVWNCWEVIFIFLMNVDKVGGICSCFWVCCVFFAWSFVLSAMVNNHLERLFTATVWNKHPSFYCTTKMMSATALLHWRWGYHNNPWKERNIEINYSRTW